MAASVGAVATTAGSATTAPRSGVSNAAEVVMGALVGLPTPSFLAPVRNGKMGGVILPRNGWLTHSTAARVTAELQQAACARGEPLLIAVDQEGGIVRRLAWAPRTEAPAQMTDAADAQAQATGAATALRSVGIGVDLAPVVDTPSSPRSFLGMRAFSRSVRGTRAWRARSSTACRRTPSPPRPSTSLVSGSRAATPATDGS